MRQMTYAAAYYRQVMRDRAAYTPSERLHARRNLRLTLGLRIVGRPAAPQRGPRLALDALIAETLHDD